jgi:hypothetical protein
MPTLRREERPEASLTLTTAANGDEPGRGLDWS